MKVKCTQREKILHYLYGFGSITSWEAYRDLGITQFAARVKELKEEGYEFTSKWENRKNQEGEVVRFKRYYLRN